LRFFPFFFLPSFLNPRVGEMCASVTAPLPLFFYILFFSFPWAAHRAEVLYAATERPRLLLALPLFFSFLSARTLQNYAKVTRHNNPDFPFHPTLPLFFEVFFLSSLPPSHGPRAGVKMEQGIRRRESLPPFPLSLYPFFPFSPQRTIPAA